MVITRREGTLAKPDQKQNHWPECDYKILFFKQNDIIKVQVNISHCQNKSSQKEFE